MLRRFSPVLLATQFVTDLILTLLAVKLAEQARIHIVTHFEIRGQYLTIPLHVYALVFGVWALLFLLFGTFESGRRTSMLVDLGHLWFSITLSMLVLASLFYLVGPDPTTAPTNLQPQPPAAPSRLFYVYFYIIDLTLLTLEHVGVFLGLVFLRRRGRHLRRVLLVGAGVQGRHVAIRLKGREDSGLSLVGYLSHDDESAIHGLTRLGTPADLPRVVGDRHIDEVVMALPAHAHTQALRMTDSLRETEVSVRILPDVFEMVAMKARMEDFYGLPLISIREPSINPVQARIKRLFDIVIAGPLLISLSPAMFIIALCIRFDSPGPVLIHQRRVGAAGVPFYMHKFRSMHWEPEGLDKGGVKVPNDPRVTRVGKVLRRTSLDELPQLWNVLRGEMSLVGPRPELPAIVDLYEPWQLKRFVVPPGMTGWWQVNGRAERSMHMNTEIDLYYVQNYSILLDIQILLRTLGAVIKGRGAF